MHRTVTAVGQCLASILSLTVVLSASGCKDTGSISEGPQVRLSSLSVSEPGLQPAFSSATTNYTLNVPSTVASLTVTATPENSSTSITIAGTASQNLSVDLTPPGSSKDIAIVLTEQSGSQSSYIVTVNRAAPLSGNNELSNLTVSSGSLTPGFSPGTLNYTVDVATDITSVTVTTTKSDPNAVLSGDVPNSGQATIPLDGPGSSKTVSVTVTAPNQVSRIYRITINRLAPSNNANLSTLTVTAGTLNPGFAAGTLNYTVTVPASVDSLTVTGTKSDPNAVMSASGSVIAPAGVATGSVSSALGLGSTTLFTISVIAQDGVSTRPYTINVFRDLR
jgi:Cadherin-like beta sandwich domain